MTEATGRRRFSAVPIVWTATAALASGLLSPCVAMGERAPAASATEFSVSLNTAQSVVAACAGAPSGCDAARLPTDAEVCGADGRPFRASWLWLREAVSKARGSATQERVESMRDARGHLDEMTREAGSSQSRGGAAAFVKAKSAAENILAGAEFQADAGPTWWDRQLARLQDWFLRLLLGMDRVGTHNPWIAPLVEWTCFLLAAAGLLLFVRRSLTRQALRIALGEGAVGARIGGRDATDWLFHAQERSAAGDWREGVHCLYWAAIVSLESRRAWRPNPTRTPREYVRLLPPGSAAAPALQGLTRSLEQVWYGHGRADEADFRAAQENYEAIRTAELHRNGAEGRRRNSENSAAVGAA